MKLQTIVILVLAVFMLSVCGTVMGTKAPPEARTMERIIDVADAPRDELYIKANTWFVDTLYRPQLIGH